MVEAILQHRRRYAVVLRGAHYDDRHRRLLVSLPRRMPDLHVVQTEIQPTRDDGQRRQQCQPTQHRHRAARPTLEKRSLAVREALQDPYPSNVHAWRRRASVRSRPNSSSAWNSGGPTSRPVIATRTGACALPGLNPSSPRALATAALSVSASHADRVVNRLDHRVEQGRGVALHGFGPGVLIVRRFEEQEVDVLGHLAQPLDPGLHERRHRPEDAGRTLARSTVRTARDSHGSRGVFELVDATAHGCTRR